MKVETDVKSLFASSNNSSKKTTLQSTDSLSSGALYILRRHWREPADMHFKYVKTVVIWMEAIRYLAIIQTLSVS